MKSNDTPFYCLSSDVSEEDILNSFQLLIPEREGDDEDVRRFFVENNPTTFIQLLAGGYSTGDTDHTLFDQEIRQDPDSAVFVERVDQLHDVQIRLKVAALQESATADFRKKCYLLFRGTEVGMQELVKSVQMQNFVNGGNVKSAFTGDGAGLAMLNSFAEIYRFLGYHEQALTFGDQKSPAEQ